jgi:hypothetical protein
MVTGSVAVEGTNVQRTGASFILMILLLIVILVPRQTPDDRTSRAEIDADAAEV